MNIKIIKVFCCKIYHVCMLLCKTANFFVSVNMLVFSDVVESKRFESIAPMVDGSVETVDVVGCLKGPSLKVDVATDTDDLVTQTDQACWHGHVKTLNLDIIPPPTPPSQIGSRFMGITVMKILDHLRGIFVNLPMVTM